METSGPIADSPPDSPTIYILAGPNGAGKTTFASRFLPESVRCREFLNADLIAKGLSPFAPETQNVRAARLLLERVRELSEQRADFGIETTLSGRTYFKLLTDLKKLGYREELFFLWLPDVQMAVDRVANRVRQGGHNIPTDDIRRRYSAGLRNLRTIYIPLVDQWHFHDSSHLPTNSIEDDQAKAELIGSVGLSGDLTNLSTQSRQTTSRRSIKKLAQEAFLAAGHDAVKVAETTHTPILVWEDKRTKAIDVQEACRRLQIEKQRVCELNQ